MRLTSDKFRRIILWFSDPMAQLDDLPVEIQEHIFRKLDPRSVLNVSETSIKYNIITNTDRIWKTIVSEKCWDINCYHLYIHKYSHALFLELWTKGKKILTLIMERNCSMATKHTFFLKMIDSFGGIMTIELMDAAHEKYIARNMITFGENIAILQMRILGEAVTRSSANRPKDGNALLNSNEANEHPNQVLDTNGGHDPPPLNHIQIIMIMLMDRDLLETFMGAMGRKMNAHHKATFQKWNNESIKMLKALYPENGYLKGTLKPIFQDNYVATQEVLTAIYDAVIREWMAKHQLSLSMEVYLEQSAYFLRYTLLPITKLFTKNYTTWAKSTTRRKIIQDGYFTSA